MVRRWLLNSAAHWSPRRPLHTHTHTDLINQHGVGPGHQRFKRAPDDSNVQQISGTTTTGDVNRRRVLDQVRTTMVLDAGMFSE